MSWGHIVGAVFAGMFLVNAVPHFVKGICGDRFPTPFAKPPGKGLSSAPVNVVWALVNLVVGCLLWRYSRPLSGRAEMVALALACAVFSVWSSTNFQHKYAE